MKATFLIAASLIVGSAAIAQTPPVPDPAAPPPATDATAPPPAPAPDATVPAPPPAPDATMNASPPAETVAPVAPTDTSSYPPCSRTVHDRCVQTHEVRRARPHR
ncbi:MAG TPA: hypothetical protein VNT42_08610 [Sphingomonas sp.]|nr:hypothetical protein [Sphingomonas sp.]